LKKHLFFKNILLNSEKCAPSKGSQFAFFWNRALLRAAIGDTHHFDAWGQLRTPIKCALISARKNRIGQLMGVLNIPQFSGFRR
jgi:hypothetical protein